MYEHVEITMSFDILTASMLFLAVITLLGYITHRKAQKIHQELVDEGFYDD